MPQPAHLRTCFLPLRELCTRATRWSSVWPLKTKCHRMRTFVEAMVRPTFSSVQSRAKAGRLPMTSMLAMVRRRREEGGRPPQAEPVGVQAGCCGNRQQAPTCSAGPAVARASARQAWGCAGKQG